MFGFLFKRRKSIDNKEKEPRNNGKSRKDVSSSSSSINSKSYSSSQLVLAENIEGDEERHNSTPNSAAEFSEMCPSNNVKPQISIELDEKAGLFITESEQKSEELKYFSLADLSKGISFVDASDSNSTDKVGKLKRDFSHEDVDKNVKIGDCLKRDLSEAERNAMVELDEIRSKILAKDTEISLLHADVNMLSVDRDNKIVEIEDLSSQLRRIQEENETSLATVQSIEIELGAMKEKNSQLTSDLLKKADLLSRVEQSSLTGEKSVKDYQFRIKTLEKKIEALELERKRLIEEHEAVEVEREEELRALQNALDDALEEKIKLQNKFDRDFQALRNSCSSQEQQLMDDFEWKLRQIESSCKKKLLDKDRQTEEKLKDIKNGISKELDDEREKIREEKVLLDEQTRQVSHFKAYEVELIQLRGLTHEQQKCMRSASRQIEHLKFSEKLLRDDLRAIKGLLEKEKNNLQTVQVSHQRRLETQDENVHVQLGKQRTELNSKFEERLRAECSRLKQDLCKHLAEEKHLAVESMRLQKDQEISSSKQLWEKKKQDLIQEISKLKDTIAEKEIWSCQELEKLRTQADRESWELRRKMEKESISHDDRIAELKGLHKDEIDSLRKQFEVVTERLREVEKQLVESEQKNSKFASIGSSNGKLSPLPHTNPVNKSDSGCGDDVSEDEDEDDEDADADEEDESEEEEVVNKKQLVVNKKITSLINNDDSSSCSELVEETVVHSLREEVANLQGSIEKLTSTLATEGESGPTTNKPTSSERSSSSEEEGNTSSSESDDDE